MMQETLAAPHPAATPQSASTSTEVPIPIAVAYGDGIGPEITEAVLRVLDAADAPLRYDVIDIGKTAYERGVTSGIPDDAWDAIRQNRVLLKGPITTPQGGGYKSLNVTLREALSLFAKVSTEAFTDAVIERLGAEPSTLTPVRYQSGGIQVEPSPTPDQEKVLRGADVFIDWDGAGRDPDVIGQGLEEAAKRTNWRLKMITNRGVKVYPDGLPETFWTDHWRCRFLPQDADGIPFDRVLDLLGALHATGWDVIKTEHLYTFDGRRAYSLGQGE